MADDNDILTVTGLSKEFFLHMLGGKVISGCEQVSFTVRQGEFMSITGPSGAGKSTIIKCIYRTYRPSAGRIAYRSAAGRVVDLATIPDREVLTLRRREIAYVSQFLQVMPRVAAVDVVAEGLRRQGWTADTARQRAREYLALMGIDPELWDAYPATFSGGEQQRVNLARAIITDPRLLLLDEPTASLDGETKKVVVRVLHGLKERGTTVIGIFHDLDAMHRLADRVFTMKGGRCKSIRKRQEVV